MPGKRTHREVIKLLGGPVHLARVLGLPGKQPTSIHWNVRGIPPAYWHRVCDLLALKGIKLTPHELDATKPPPEPKRRRRPATCCQRAA